MMYTMTQFPVEGFFKGYDIDGQANDAVANKMWKCTERLYKGWMQRRSMTCSEVGYNLGVIYQSLINFEVQSEMLYHEVSM